MIKYDISAKRGLDEMDNTQKKKNAFSIAALVCGVGALITFLMLINIPLAIAAVVCGLIAIGSGQAKKAPAAIGIACALISIVLMVGGWAVIINGISGMDRDSVDEFTQKLMDEGTAL